MQDFITQVTQVDSIWSVIARGILWLVVALVIIVSTDNPDPEEQIKNVKSNLGFLLVFVMLSGGLLYLLFGYVPQASV